MKLFLSISSLLLASTLLPAQTPWDSSGNGLLRGAYNFRQVHLETADDQGNLARAIAIWGTITFDGSGNYSISNASVLDSQAGTTPRSFSITGAYRISANGLGFLDSPALEGGLTYGLVAQGIFIGSTTEENEENLRVNDLFIAAPAPSPAPDNAAFNGSYWISEMNVSSLTISRSRDAQFRINPNGQGALGSISAVGYTGASGNPQLATINGATYSFSAGAGTLNFGTSSNVVSGTRILYMTADRNFIFGGSNAGWDIFVGVRALTSPPAQSLLSGLYYQVGLDQDNNTLNDASDPHVTVDTYFGSFNAVGSDILGHQRLLTAFSTSAFDFTYSDFFNLASDGSHEDLLGFKNILGANGNIRIGFGQQTFLGVHVALKAPSFSGSGVYLNPIGVVNAASFVPVTVGVSAGSLVRLYGTNLSSSTTVNSSFPTTLGGVQVLVNNTPAPIYLVSPDQVVVLIPWATSGAYVGIQVINNGTASNVVTVFRALATPGVFTLDQNGLGYSAALRPDFSIITPQNPARAGETVALYVTGLGEVNPTVADGAPGRSAEPLNRTVNPVSVRVRGRNATVAYAGLAPGFVGLYQVNATIPADTPGGDAYVNIGIADGLNSQALLPIRAGTGDALESDAGSAPEATRIVPRRSVPPALGRGSSIDRGGRTGGIRPRTGR